MTQFFINAIKLVDYLVFTILITQFLFILYVLAIKFDYKYFFRSFCI